MLSEQSKLSAWIKDKVSLPEFIQEAIQVKSTTSIEQHELTLLDQEYKLAFAYCDRKRTSTVDARQLEDALVYVGGGLHILSNVVNCIADTYMPNWFKCCNAGS